MKTRKKAIALAAALLAALLVVPLLAGGTAGREAAAADNGGGITLPIQTYVGYVTYVAKSDLPRFELVGRVIPPPYRPGGPSYVPPFPREQRYVLLARADAVAPLKQAAESGAKGLRVPVRIKGAPVIIPGLARTSQAIVVQTVELLRPEPLK